MGRTKGCDDKSPGKTRKIQMEKFGQYHLDLSKHPHNEYPVHIYCDGDNRFGLGSRYISMSLKTWPDFIKLRFARLKVVSMRSLLF